MSQLPRLAAGTLALDGDTVVLLRLRDRRFASVIPGAASIEQIEENVRCATAGPLPDELHARLDALGRVFVQEPRLKG